MEYIRVIVIVIIAIILWFCVFVVLKKHSENADLSSGLARLGIFSGIWAIVSAFLRWNGLNGNEIEYHHFLSFSSILIFSVLVLDYSPHFLMVKTSNQKWIIYALGFLIIILPFSVDLFGIPEYFTIGNSTVPRLIPAAIATSVGLMVTTLRSVRLTAIAFNTASQPSHKNRLLYWTLALGVFILGYIFVLFEQSLAGKLFCLSGFLILIYVVLAPNLKDLIRMGSQSLRFGVMAVLTVGVYTAGFLIAEVILSGMRVAQPVLTALLLAAVFVLILNPAVSWIAQRLNNLVFGHGYNPSVIVRDFGQSIGNVVDLRLLKQVTLGLFSKVIGIKKGNLYLVDEFNENGILYYRLSPIRSGDGSDEAVIEGRMSASSPVAIHFSQLKQPLLQYDLVFSSVYRELPPADRDWLMLQNAEVFVPILTKVGWIGLFILGAKQSGEKYTEDDLLLLSTLADQTAVALENARLFVDLSRVNHELQLAQVDLQMANQQLREMDNLKSSFIGVVTHELRTPLANMAFSLQILRMYGPEQLSQEQIEQIEHVEQNLTTIRMMVDNLITLATFLNKQIDLNLESLDFKALTSDVTSPLKKLSDEKGIDLQVYFVGDLLPIQADRKLLSDAVYHLVQNAIKFTPKSGKIWITCWTATDLLYFDVKDTGIGIPRERLKSLWDGFSQVSNPDLRGQEGLGLGLALVRFIIAAHGGKVWVESVQGEGSTFGFRIPLAGPNAVIDPINMIQGKRDITNPIRRQTG